MKIKFQYHHDLIALRRQHASDARFDGQTKTWEMSENDCNAFWKAANERLAHYRWEFIHSGMGHATAQRTDKMTDAELEKTPYSRRDRERWGIYTSLRDAVLSVEEVK